MDTVESRIYFAVIIGSLVFAVIITTLVIMIVRYQKRKTSAYAERLQMDINSLEAERLRIAKDLHDDLGSTLSAIKIKLQCIEADNLNNKGTVAEAEQYIDAAMNKLRNVSLNLMPQILERNGLNAALDELFERQLSSSNIKLHTNYNFGKKKPSDIHVYRIVQEIITNIIKHSHASNVHMATKQIVDQIIIHIYDDGIGFNKKTILKNNKGLGLHNIMSRINILNATLLIKTTPGSGVDYLIKLPSD